MDTKNGQCHRADKLIEDGITKLLAKKKKPEERQELEQVIRDCGEYNQEAIDGCIQKYGLKAPESGNDLTEARPFNLMFGTDIGPTGQLKGYLRPETAQGIFLNFRRLIEFNNGRMPCAGAQVGLAFRNEIAPRQGLLRVREFSIAEIEHFVDPLDKSHHKFDTIQDEVLPLYSAQAQEVGGPVLNGVTLKEAVEQKMIDNQTLAYFMGRSYKFLIACGIQKEAIRYRQHRQNEMAHYAKDCWDAEVETSYGWIEIAGHADRSCFDLAKHSEKTGVELVAARKLKEPMVIEYLQVTLEKPKIGKEFKKDSKAINEAIEKWTEEEKKAAFEQLQAEKSVTIKVGNGINLSEEHIKIEKKEKTIMEEKFIPHVIEPSFGIGRIIYCIFEHCFRVREKDANRTYFDFPISVAPIKCSILPLMAQDIFVPKVRQLKNLLTRAGISSKVDDSGATVGKRYARTDECGIPYALTIDHQTLEDSTVTMRDLKSMNQIRISIEQAAESLNDLMMGRVSWEDLQKKYPNAEAVVEEEK